MRVAEGDLTHREESDGKILALETGAMRPQAMGC